MFTRKSETPKSGRRNVGSGLVVPVARVALWLAVAVVLFHGLGDIFGPEPERAVNRAAVAEVWPDDSARAFAEQFVSALLTVDPAAEEPEARVARFLAPGLAASEMAAVAEDAELQVVHSTSVADARPVDGTTGVVTVAAEVGATVEYVAVRVSRDAAGGLAVADFPAFVAPPSRAGVRWDEPVKLDEGPLERHVEQFLSAYLGGSDELAYLAVPGSRIGRPSRTLVDVQVEGVYPVGPQRGRVRTVAASVGATDADTGAEWRLRYELVVEKRDRWLVAEIDG